MTTVRTIAEEARKKAMQALHAEGRKRGFDHQALRELAGVESLKSLKRAQIVELTNRLRGGEGVGDRKARRRRGLATRKAQSVGGVIELVDAKAIEIIRGLAEALGWSNERLEKFTARQLNGRTEIRTIGDANAVIRGMRAIYRRGV